MAKYETTLQGDFDQILDEIHNAMMNNSVSTSFEDSSTIKSSGIKCYVGVYERYSFTGKNRVSMTITLVSASDNRVFFSAITSGGSQAVFFKFNTFGESSFLDTIQEIISEYEV